MKHERHGMKRIVSSVLGLWAAACSGSAEDRTELRALSSSELRGWCEQMASEWPSPDLRTTCDDGSSVTVLRDAAFTCGEGDLSQCGATVGDAQDCVELISSDPCGASRALPASCARLQAAGCASAWSPPLFAESCEPVDGSDVAALEGIYELTHHTANPTSCEGEGPSRLEDVRESFFVLVTATALGSPFGALQTCTDVEACRARAVELTRAASGAAPGEPPELELALMCRGDGALLSKLTTGGASLDGQCDLSITETRLSSSAGVLRLESRRREWQKPRTNDECAYYAGEEPDDAACVAFAAYEARRVAEL